MHTGAADCRGYRKVRVGMSETVRVRIVEWLYLPMVSMEHEPITWVWESGANFPEAESFLAFGGLQEEANLQTRWTTGIVISQK